MIGDSSSNGETAGQFTDSEPAAKIEKHPESSSDAKGISVIGDASSLCKYTNSVVIKVD